ncbi:2-oxoglutarate and iron-dependent oxygenase domain-containing protein [Mesorhizobium sp.]|uniref:2-oxoglutarate and iron-dependent oxygenase domain-containing protein n=1 Tax=Mesorhizobium sp. TaxID=1871066 RepID=UPI00257D30DD|nr:2-oxoglutarate and iron-dependent oxygenase domain-containing protein [Mesorhizobium sp.]
MFNVSRRFFDFAHAAEDGIACKQSDVALRGYIEPFGENTDPGKTKDLKECFDIGPERPTPEGPFFGSNQWPQPCPSFPS